MYLKIKKTDEWRKLHNEFTVRIMYLVLYKIGRTKKALAEIHTHENKGYN
jgi:hypothetical protein